MIKCADVYPSFIYFLRFFLGSPPPQGNGSGSRADCQSVGQTVRESGRLSECRADCQRVGQTVRVSGRLSESRADCQRVGQTVRESGRLSESRADCQRVGQTVRVSGNRFFQWSQPHFLFIKTEIISHNCRSGVIVIR